MSKGRWSEGLGVSGRAVHIVLRNEICAAPSGGKVVPSGRLVILALDERPDLRFGSRTEWQTA